MLSKLNPISARIKHNCRFDVRKLSSISPYPKPLLDGICKDSSDADSSSSSNLTVTDISNRKDFTTPLLRENPDPQRKYNELEGALLKLQTQKVYVSESDKNLDLRERQKKLENEQLNEAANDVKHAIENMMSMGKGSSLKYVQKYFLQWYEKLHAKITEELRLIEMKVPGKIRSIYGPALFLLPVEKLCVITLNTAINSIFKSGNSGSILFQIGKSIGDMIQTEVNVIKMQKQKAGLSLWEKNLLKEITTAPGGFNISKNKNLVVKLRKLLDHDDWSLELKLKIGIALLSLLNDSAVKTDGKPVFIYQLSQFRPSYSSYNKRIKIGTKASNFKKTGILKLDPEIFYELSLRGGAGVVLPRHLPMLIPPNKWDNKDKDCTPYLHLKAPLVRTNSKDQLQAVRQCDMEHVLEAMDYLSSMPWKINTQVLDVVRKSWDEKLEIAGLPSQFDVPLPLKENCYKLKVKEGDEVQVNNVYRSRNKKNNKTIHINSSEYDSSEIEFDSYYYREMTRRVSLRNAELHSLRCDTNLKLWVAEKFIGEKIYFPFNIDFRGRTYPIPPNLNHLGNDLCRGVLSFEVGKELGPNGLDWMKVHLANLFGNNKISHAERIAWCDDHMEDIFDSAKNPLGADAGKWWLQAEEPFQCLATCIEMVQAIESSNPDKYVSHLPIHQDGSCNGLQHYAALGRDELGARAVNLTKSNEPQDVYTAVLKLVLAKIDKDCLIPENHPDEGEKDKGKHARMVRSVVDRKVIKQTVMTSVYGVTRIGAREQVHDRLEEKLVTDPSAVTDPNFDTELFYAARYVANLTLDSLQEMFSGAKGIMDWLTKCAGLVSLEGHAMSWLTPLGLPVMQPYRKTMTHTVKTLMQSVTLTYYDDSLPVSNQKQRSAFPPNFVHSLDATHMFLTCLKMKDKGLTFTSVHDSYWTHACDVPVMNDALRECFVDLYSLPILENLKKSLEVRYPQVKFPPIPTRGNLDLELVKDSSYFFH